MRDFFSKKTLSSRVLYKVLVVLRDFPMTRIIKKTCFFFRKKMSFVSSSFSLVTEGRVGKFDIRKRLERLHELSLSRRLFKKKLTTWKTCQWQRQGPSKASALSSFENDGTPPPLGFFNTSFHKVDGRGHFPRITQ